MLTREEQRRLLEVARAALEARVQRLAAPEVAPRLSEGPRAGAFVTILHGGELRGCLGRTSTNLRLEGLVAQLAQAVADSDPRFDPVRGDELAHITIEISVLTTETEVQSPSDVELGRHGLMVEHGGRRGLLLPQVPAEQGWDLDAFLSHTCLKAGVSADAWRRGARLYVFEAQVFREGGS
jgi:AmmeMemoRadiSam system protein A